MNINHCIGTSLNAVANSTDAELSAELIIARELHGTGVLTFDSYRAITQSIEVEQKRRVAAEADG